MDGAERLFRPLAVDTRLLRYHHHPVADRWSGIAGIVRGKFLELREEDFVTAADCRGWSQAPAVIFRHLVPSFASYLIVQLTLSVPHMILGETRAEFSGAGDSRAGGEPGHAAARTRRLYVSVVALPWLLIPAIFLIVIVLAFNFLGDGLRDSADPYKQ